MSDTFEEGQACPEKCGGHLSLPAVKNCSCHINPPCSACVNRLLTCDVCGWEEPEEIMVYQTVLGMMLGERIFKRPSKDLGNGKLLYDYDYDSRSGSTMVYKGRYEGPVTPQDILEFFGDGTFGHRGPSLYNGAFTYTKITD